MTEPTPTLTPGMLVRIANGYAFVVEISADGPMLCDLPPARLYQLDTVPVGSAAPTGELVDTVPVVPVTPAGDL